MAGSPSRPGAFHTFQIFEPSNDAFAIASDVQPENRYAPKRSHIPTACTECKRRKVRCDGNYPCGPCLSSSASSRARRRRCYYITPRPRVMPSKRALEDASSSLADCHSILRRLFPIHDVQELLPLSREDLIALLRLDQRSAAEAHNGARPEAFRNPSPLNDIYTSPMRGESPKPKARAARSPLSATPSQPGSLAAASTVASLRSNDGDLTILEPVPTPDAEWDEERREREQEHVPAEADDVNALSFALDRQVSYLGISSIRAALLVMLKLRPSLRQEMAPDSAPSLPRRPLVHLPMRDENDASNSDRRYSSTSDSVWPRRPSQARTLSQQQLSKPALSTRVAWSRRGQALVDAYFRTFHMYMPMLDEPIFRAEFAGAKSREDEPWQALANMVLALGSVAAARSDDQEAEHATYYERAVSLLPLTALGSSHIETVQTLALMGGEYLHYVNRPNMAYGVLGAAIRMAGALGLHKEALTAPPTSSIPPALQKALETRRRTWWTLFCVDTWATMLTGRPSFGRWELATNIVIPDGGVAENDSYVHKEVGDDGRRVVEAESTEDETDQTSDAELLRQLAEGVKFAKIATRVQDAFAVSPIITTALRQDIDSQLAAWHLSQSWPSSRTRSTQKLSRDNASYQDAVGDEAPWRFTQSLMKWRYQDLRMLLHRPVLLFLANSGCSDWEDCSPDDAAAVKMCLALAIATVEDVEREWTPSRIAGWKAAWYLHQASMVPLLILLWNPRNMPNETVLEPCRRAIPMVLSLLEAMKPWSLTANRSSALIGRVFEAATQGAKVNVTDENDPARSTSFMYGGPDAIPAASNNGNSEQLLDDGNMTRAVGGDMAQRTAAFGSIPIQEALDFNFGLNFGFLGYEQDAAMGGSMKIDSFDMLDPFWGQNTM
ncbi:hypothetical protein N5P37_008214 [Trichoderma harzianum]|nr:hypothetical protein N5P37_008214 [Trichoderma harzianum]